MDDAVFTLGKYRIHQEIGRGGMGVVYLAEDVNLLRKVAVKTLRPSMGNHGKHLERFKREGQAVASLYHPNIVHINALEIIDGQLLIEMPYFSRGSVRELLDAGASPKTVVRILRDVLMALECCHEAGIIHRDVKPNNLLIDDAGKILLTDFGVAALLDAEWEATLSGNSTSLCFAGTPLYMSPGAWEGVPPSPHHDLYALGIIAREAATGAPPFSGPTPLAMMRMILESELPPVCECAPALSTQLGALIDDLGCRSGTSTELTATEALHRLRDTPEYEGADQGQEITQDIPRTLQKKARAITTRRRLFLWRPWAMYAGALLLTILAVAVGYLLHGTAGRTTQVNQTLDTSPRPVRQVDLITDNIPTESNLLQSYLVLEPGRHRVVNAASSVDTGAPFPVLLNVEPRGDTVRILACKANAIWGFDLRLQSPEHYAITGTWAQYATEAGEAFRWATLSGSAHWGGEINAPMSINLEGISQSDVARWSEVWVVDTAEIATTDTTFLRDFEAQPSSLAIIYNEMPARVQAETWDFKSLLPSLHNGTLRVEQLLPPESISIDGGLDDIPWSRLRSAAAPGAPTHENSRLQAVFTPEALFIALSVPAPSDFAWEIELVFTERFSAPLADSVTRHAYWDPSLQRQKQIQGGISTPVTPDWQLQSQQSGANFTAEIQIPFRHEVTGEAGTIPTPRLNLVVFQRSAPDTRTPIAQWGWPEIAAFAHGMELDLIPSENNGTPP